MSLNEYQQQAITLAVYPEQYEIAYPTLGLIEEVGELLGTPTDDPDAIIKEMGDVMWYCSATAYDLGLHLEDCYEEATIQMMPDVEALFKNATALAGRVKKILRGDKDREGKVQAVRGYVGDIVRRIEALAIPYEISLEEVCERNLDKLFDRKDRGVLKGDGDNR